MFGCDKNIAKLWAKYRASSNVTYKVEWEWKDKKGFFYVEKSKITKGEVVSNESVENILCKDIDSAIEQLKNDIKNCDKKINKVAPIVSAYTNMISIFEDASNKWYHVECDKDMKPDDKGKKQEEILDVFRRNITNLPKNVTEVLGITKTEVNTILSGIEKEGIKVVCDKLKQYNNHTKYTTSKKDLNKENKDKNDKSKEIDDKKKERNRRIREFSENISKVLFTIELVDSHH